MLIKPNGFAEAVEVPLTREQLKQFLDFEQMCESMHLAFQMRCRKCHEAGDPDGVWGNNLTTATQYVVECRCTKRVYRGADVKLPGS